MWDQTITVYHKTEQDERPFYEREVLAGVQFTGVQTETIENGMVRLPASTLMVRQAEAAARLQVGDLVVEGTCPVPSFAGNPAKPLAGTAFGRVKSAKRYRFASKLRHDTFLLD